MSDDNRRKTRLGRLGKILLFGIGTFFCILLLLALALKIYLTTPLAAAHLSRLLTSHLRQPVRVTGLQTAGGALYLNGLSLGNPSGFPAGNLASADFIAIAPQWTELLLGRRRFRLIALEGIRLDIQKNNKGAWNFSQLQQLLTGGKPATGETFIEEFAVKGGALQINGQGVKGLSLQIFNMTNRGSADSRIALSFEDGARNRYRIEGKARTGKEPALDLALTAPSLSLERMARMLKLKNTPLLEGGSGQLRVDVELHEGRLRVRGGLDFSRLRVLLAQGMPPLTGRLFVAADYNLHTDEARLETFALTVNNLVKAQASGTATNIRQERRFKLDFDIDQIDLGTLALFLAEPERRRLVLKGTLCGREIRLSGNGVQGVTSASGSLVLQNGSLIRDGQLIVSGLDGYLSLSGTDIGFLAKGRVSRRQSGKKALLESVDAPIEVNLSPRMKPLVVTLRDAGFRFGGTSVTIARLAALVPVRESGAGTDRLPLSLEISGVEIHQGQVALNALSGTLRASYSSEAGDRWLEGTLELAAGDTSWQGRALGAPAVRVVFSRSGGKGKLSGTLLGGKLSGGIDFNPFAPEEGGAFQLGIRGARLMRAADFLPRRGGVTLAGGLLDATLDGGYSRRKGLNCRFAARGSDLALAGSGGKILLAKGGIGISGAVSGPDISISDAVLSAGEAVVVKAKGELANALSSKREGGFTIALPETAVNSLVDPIANILPRSLQEANIVGAVAAEARFDLHNGRKLLNGSILLKGVGLELPSQRFTAADIKGTLPFSLDFSGGGAARTGDALSFSRQNYPRLLELFRQLHSAGPAVTVGKLSFGALELGPLTMHVTAGDGITEITALRASLYQGDLFGKGYVTARPGLHYRGDLLVNDLSLLQFCNAFPKIRGYISGRLDGIVSLSGKGTAKTALLGFSELWTRSGSGEKMLVSREFLQKLAGKKLRGFFFRNDRPYDQAEVKAILKEGSLNFETLDILHTTFPGIRDLSVSVAPGSNRISLERLFSAIKQAEASGKAVSGEKGPAEAPVETEFKWLD